MKKNLTVILVFICCCLSNCKNNSNSKSNDSMQPYDGYPLLSTKEEIKEHLGRSPDFGDCLMMRMLFVLKKPYVPYISYLSRNK
jgi:hypothetical protein